ncbi:GNAT family N-acetyltransferase [Bifidobacterium biavatii]|uniref:GNAT family acetyltransferase n=1 Tax=Bifidobacterium biavatii DSM 23969 TaxID=1437608 RepID=A0A086ZMZ0_9BIFI|nr:GNAT family N-acetyltransferase [Bifidobacterium biavatii]KFI47890.1 GNAT family acetyltransferase [Bifidobacterium biavatii DSM 23969]
MSEHVASPFDQETSRELPARIVIPPIKGEMVHLRPATVEDLPRLDELDAYYNASRITGKDAQAERAVVHTWVRRSVAWANGQTASESGVGDPESRRTIAWAVLTDSDHDDDGKIDAAATDNVIGMVFLIDIDGWARSARIQVLLGKDYRGRGYSRDMMPRVMTYGFAPEPSGLGMHRIWVAVPEKNTRSLSVYQSLGFVKTGSSRDALWDAENSRYQDLIVLDTLFDEYDPIRSLDAFGMHVIEDNPGMREALAMREHSVAIQQRRRNDGRTDAEQTVEAEAARREAYEKIGVTPASDNGTAVGTADGEDKPHNETTNDETSNWPYGQSERKSSKNAWWRNLGLNRKRDTEED